MKKRVLAAMFAVMMAFGATACGNAAENTQAEEQNAEVAEETGTVGLTEEEKETLAESMKAELSKYPVELPAEAAVEAGMYTIANGAVAGGQEKWDAFLTGETDSVVLCQYAQDGYAIVDSVVRCEDNSYFIVSDNTRNTNAAEEEKYYMDSFKTVDVFREFMLNEDSAPVTVAILTDETKMNENMFRKSWKGELQTAKTYLLFVVQE